VAGLWSVLAMLNVGGCADPGVGFFGIDGGGDAAGVTSGGAEDVAWARAQIEAGWIPDPDSIAVEGFLSEHDIPVTPPEDPTSEIYPSVAVAWRRPFGEVAPMADLFVALGTTIDLDTFRRRQLNLVAVVDRSTSMSWSASDAEWRPRLSAVKEALYHLVDQLDGDDRLTIVSFSNSWRVDLPGTAGSDKDAAHAAIDRLKARGNTSMFAALKRGFELAEQQKSDTRASRVILFTDAQPNVGPEGSSQFIELIRSFAAEDIGFTLMGVGWDFGDELAREISYVRDANSFYLANSDRISTVFDEDFDFLVTPVAHDLVLDVRIPDGVGIRDVYGVPDYIPGTGGARIVVPTMFLSRREGGGAIVVRLTTSATPTFEEDVTFGELSLRYTLADGTRERSSLDVTVPAGTAPTGDPPYFSDPSLRRAALLLDTALVLKDADRAAYQGREADAGKMLTAFLAYFDQASLGMSDRTGRSSRGLRDERDLLETLLGAVQSRPTAYY
jgi:Ca-activated chloride channel family protein